MGPLIVCGTGGSGTRAIADYLIRGGLFMGCELNESLDSMPFARLLTRFIGDWLDLRNGKESAFSTSGFMSAWQATEVEHRAEFEGAHWGTKNPSMILIIDLLYQLIPSVRVLHVLRDGVEMAFSSNQRQLVLYGDKVLGPNLSGESDEVRSLRFWQWANSRAAKTGEAHPGRYARVRYEQFCLDPVGEMQRISAELDLGLDHASVEPQLYQRSSRQVDESQRALLGPLVEEVRPLLASFGY